MVPANPTETLRPGDTVKLNSGGPHMTVWAIVGENKNSAGIWCEWFDVSNQVQRHCFKPSMLTCVRT